ncbi:hypothetical protein ACNOYE_18365 [Nannocystaceae bacterium ST9]
MSNPTTNPKPVDPKTTPKTAPAKPGDAKNPNPQHDKDRGMQAQPKK